MELTTENLQEWKDELNRIAMPYVGERLSDTLSDNEWIEDNSGHTPEDVLAEILRADY